MNRCRKTLPVEHEHCYSRVGDFIREVQRDRCQPEPRGFMNIRRHIIDKHDAPKWAVQALKATFYFPGLSCAQDSREQCFVTNPNSEYRPRLWDRPQ